MKHNFAKVILLTILFVSSSVIAQDLPLDSLGRLKTKHSSIIVGGGGVKFTDNYLSDIEYSGSKVDIQKEGISSFYNLDKWISRDIMGISNLLSVSNSMSTKIKLSYTRLAYYRFEPYKNFNFYAGAGYSISGGMNSDASNQNNIMYFNAALDFRLSGMITYRLPFENFPAMFKLSSELSTIGVSFVPEYGQLFGIIAPNSSNFVFTNWANTISHKHHLGVDMPYKNITYKLAYEYEGLSSKLNNNMYKQSGSTFYVGFAYDFVKFSGKKAMNKKNIKSLIYE